VDLQKFNPVVSKPEEVVEVGRAAGEVTGISSHNDDVGFVSHDRQRLDVIGIAALRFHQPGFNGVVPLMRPAFIEDDSYFGKGVPRRRRRGPVTRPKKMATQFGSEMFMSEPLMANWGIQ
jgi:hypothetical protein